MNARTFIAVSALFLIAFVFIGSGSKKEISVEEAMKALCHTWTNPGAPGTDKDVYNHDGTFQWYYSVDSDIPNYKGTFTIGEAWVDREGNIWIIAQRRGAPVENALFKISNSGTVLEIRQFSGDEPLDVERYGFTYIRYRQ
jgi:hypothetical protein